MPLLIAKRPMRYRGKKYRPGDEFEANRMDARLLVATNVADDAPQKIYVDPLKDPALGPPATYERIYGSEAAPKKKRTYRRRDKRAEDGDYSRADLTVGDY